MSARKSLSLLLLLGLCGVAQAQTTQAASAWPLTLENCGRSETFTRPPARVVTIGQHETELLLALHLEHTLVGTSVWFGELPAAMASRAAGLPKLADNAPAFEAVAATRPDLVLAQYSWHLGPKGEVATRDQFEQIGIRTWVSPADCINKAVTGQSNGDGARTAPFSMQYITDEITQLARIFDVPQRGDALKQALEKRIRDAQEQATQPRPLSVVYWFSSPRLQGDPWVAGSDGAPGWISNTLGLKNIIDSPEEWPAVTWEHIAQAQPDLIVIASMDRRLYPADDVAVKQAFLQRDAVTREIPAVKNGHIVVVPAMSLNPSLRNVDAVEIISKKISEFQQ